MSPLPSLLLDGLFLGLGAAAPIGPVNVEIARRTLRFGRGAGFLLGCGAVTIDVAYAVVTSLTLLPLLGSPRVALALSWAAGLFLAYLGVACLRSALGGHNTSGEARDPASDVAGEGSDDRPCGARPPLARHYLTGLLMTALNPMTLGFWFAVSREAAGTARDVRLGVPIVCAGVFAGAFAWVCFFTGLAGHLKRFGGQRWLAWFDLAGGVTLLAFAGRAIWRLVDSPL